MGITEGIIGYPRNGLLKSLRTRTTHKEELLLLNTETIMSQYFNTLATICLIKIIPNHIFIWVYYAQEKSKSGLGL